MKKKKSICLLIGAVMGSVYILLLFSIFLGAAGGISSDAEIVGAGIAFMFAIPHVIVISLAILFNWLGYAKVHKGFALTAGIMYAIASVLMLPYFYLLVPSIVLSFVGYANLSKIIEANQAIASESQA